MLSNEVIAILKQTFWMANDIIESICEVKRKSIALNLRITPNDSSRCSFAFDEDLNITLMKTDTKKSNLNEDNDLTHTRTDKKKKKSPT